MTGARPAEASDEPALGAMLARAFFDDPVMVYMFPDPEARRRKLPQLFALLVQANLPLGGTDIALGGECAGLWRPPGRAGISFWEVLLNFWSFVGIYGFAGAGRALSLLGAMDRCHPKEPHWYLMVLGTAPERQGKGFGGTVLGHRLAQIDVAHSPAYLEASRPENMRLYARFGFEQQGELQIPAGPVIYPMWRGAR